MIGGRGISLAGLYFLTTIPVVVAEDNTGVIAASVVAAALVLIAFVGVTIYCFYRRRGFLSEKPKKRHKKPEYIANGVPPQNKHRKHHRHYSPHRHHSPQRNNKYQANGVSHVPHIPIQPVIRPYATYHGPPPGYYPAPPPPMKQGTFSGPPPVVVVPTPHGTITMRPDPRPVVQKRRDKRFHKSATEEEREHHKRSRSQPRSSEYLIEQSPDGIPVIRPVIYVDDDKKDRHRSKSRHKSRDRTPSGAQITEIKLSDTEVIANTVEEVEVHQRDRSRSRSRSRSKSRTPPRTPPSRRSPERSRASSVTEAVNALRMSVRQHGSKDIATDTESEVDTSRPFTPREQRAPDPVAGDVLFFPAGTDPPSLRESHKPKPDRTEQVYSYTKLIKTSTEEQTTEDPVTSTENDKGMSSSTHLGTSTVDPFLLRSSAAVRGTPEAVRSSVTANYLGTRDQEPKAYETEHTVQRAGYIYTTDLRTSMSDRITAMVEDGDKTRFSHYNVGAVTLGEESGEDEADAAVRQPATRPNDISSSIYSKPLRPSTIRPSTPPNDIPLISPSESTEIPRLNLQSSTVSYNYRPESPPRDFPITPQSSILRPRPSTPPFDADTQRDIKRGSERESVISNRSEAVNPATGEPGSFQARKRLIEAHLQKNVGDIEKGSTNPKVPRKTPDNVPRAEPGRQTSVQPTRSTIVVQPGVIPPAPPPPPLR